MARYAISAEGAASMRALAKQLYTEANAILESSSVLEAKVSAVGNGLGIYESEILSIIQQGRNTLKTNRDDILDLAQRVLQKADEIDELVSLSWGGAAVAATAGVIGGALSGSGASHTSAGTIVPGREMPKLLSREEVNNRWQSVSQTTDEVIDNYKAALISRGIPDSRMLDKFLQAEKSKMLKYESAVLNQASGHGNVQDADKYTYRIAGASGEYGFDSLAKEYGRFCLEDAAKWIKDINPNFYNPFVLPNKNPYHVNCGSCAFAVDTRLSGGNDLVATQNNIGSDYAMEVATGKQCIYMPVVKIEEYLRQQGPGSHLIVGINRGPAPNGCPQSGHWFNAFFDGENFYTIDGQSGEILDWPYDYGDVTEWCALV